MADKPQDLGVNLNLSPHQFGSFGLSTGGRELRIPPKGMSTPTNFAGQGPRGQVKGYYNDPMGKSDIKFGWHDPQFSIRYDKPRSA